MEIREQADLSQVQTWIDSYDTAREFFLSVIFFSVGAMRKYYIDLVSRVASTT